MLKVMQAGHVNMKRPCKQPVRVHPGGFKKKKIKSFASQKQLKCNETAGLFQEELRSAVATFLSQDFFHPKFIVGFQLGFVFLFLFPQRSF